MQLSNIVIPCFGYLYDLMTLIMGGYTGSIIGWMAGGRKVGKTTSILKFRLICLALPIKIRSYIVRYEVGGAVETFNELLDHIPPEFMSELTINKTERTIRHNNGNELRVIGIKSNSKKGVGKLGIKRGQVVDLVTLDIDEIYEFKNPNEVQDIVEALGSGRVYWENHMTNTWSPSHWRLARQLKKHKQVEAKMWSGEDFKMIKREDNYIEYSHYNNHRMNTLLPDNEHKKLTDLWKTDPRRARVADLGMFGVETGGIYSSYMDKVREAPSSYIPHTFYVGIDVGIRRDATTAVLMSVNRDKTQVCFHNEYYFSDAEQRFSVDGQDLSYTSKTQDDRARDIIKFIGVWVQKNNVGIYQNEIKLYTDHSSSFDEDLKRVANQQGVYYMKPELCIKPKIKKRIDMYHYLMSNRSFYMMNSCPILRQELDLAKYDDNQEMKKEVAYRLDGRDHLLNASEYAFTDIFWDVLENPRAEFYR